jgi:hypothetical protein
MDGMDEAIWEENDGKRRTSKWDEMILFVQDLVGIANWDELDGNLHNHWRTLADEGEKEKIKAHGQLFFNPFKIAYF